MKRCAIYTRKSSEEGLDQHFNSLDAQRESCEAYVLSQAGEGWAAVPARYDDGGFSGGSTDRPALQRLLVDVGRGLVDVVVVYKIDRLTRSLADFARIVERFDAKEVSFVSVTQAFNTTSSMGRLTLNVLLSFAQFEREVTGERIRDKIAASKAKGLWMGGLAPLGYDLPTNGTRVLQVNEAEATTVRHIFERYLALGSVHRLLDELQRDGIRSKPRMSAKGKTTGDQPFSRGAMFHLLQNRVYAGEIVHKGQCYSGQHEGIVERSTFDRVQSMLSRHQRKRRVRKAASSPFAGKLFDVEGNRLTPTHSKNRGGRTYRYYVPSQLQQGRRSAAALNRFPAQHVDAVIGAALMRMSATTEAVSDLLIRAELSPHSIELALPGRLLIKVRAVAANGELVFPDEANAELIRWTIPAVLQPRGGRAKVHAVHCDAPQRDAVLIQGLRTANRMVRRDRSGFPVIHAIPLSRYEVRLMRLAFLSPQIQRDILAGWQPTRLRLEDLIRGCIPLCWKAQRRMIEGLTSDGQISA
ncbi:MAG TPA: recombinase family protein [Sphingomicrobium sp.]|nr:recombinase family protein [Sphingomicrobium sp.]